ncbi:MAG: flagellar motor protein MotA [Oceanospirillaceae bacterium]|nr:flagellar motor protein MotA [Oceanospirillaceae bacterium]
MKFIVIPMMLLLASATSAAPAENLQQLLQQVGQYESGEQDANGQREREFGKNLKKQKRALAKMRAALKREQEKATRLKNTFDANEQSLTEKEEELRLRVGNLGEMFGVVRQVATDLDTVLQDSLTYTEKPERQANLAKLSEAKELPTIPELEKLWYTLQEVTRLGIFNAINEEGYLAFDSDLKSLRELGGQPAEAGYIENYLHSQDDVAVVAIDPSRGALLNMSLESPGLSERIQQGALVGYIIIAIGVIGLLLAAWRLVVLFGISAKVKKQQQSPDSPAEDNPLGRVLNTYRSLPTPLDVDALEAKMDEAVLRELPALERGQTIIKLFAAIAPLLGLLGTVTGMIATFQAITNFGTGDPKLMAAGISQALITTVLGLIAAIPLLLAHNWVASRSKALIQILDEQSAGLMAEALEKQAEQHGKGN